MRYLPWKEIRSWSCFGCGRCCERFTINLRSYEYARIANYRPDAIELREAGNPYLKRIGGRCIFQNQQGLCDLQFLDMKPFSCKIWPFIVFNQLEPDTKQNAKFHYRNEEYYVYLNPYVNMCPGINRGMAENLSLTIAEVIEIYRNPEREQKYSTSKLVTQLNQPPITIKQILASRD